MSFLSSLFNALPGAVAQGLIWGLMAIGVYITFRILDVADLTVDGSLATGGAVAVMLIRAGVNPWAALLCAFAAGMLAGFVTGVFHTKCGIPAILAGILTQLSLYSINLRIMGGKANQAVGVDKYDLLVSQRYVRTVSLDNPLPLLVVFTVVLIAVLYWFFGTEKGCSLRATGANPNMARAQGINTNANVVLGLMVSNGLVALAGGLLALTLADTVITIRHLALTSGFLAKAEQVQTELERQKEQLREAGLQKLQSARLQMALAKKELEENRLLQEAAHHSARFRKRYHLMSSRNFKESLQFVKEHATGLRQDRKDRFAQLKAERKNKNA